MAKMAVKDAHNRIKLVLTDIVDLGDFVIVKDDNKIVWADSINENILLKPSKNSNSKTLYVYTINNQDPDGILLNPINETVVASEDHRWFYQTTNRMMQTTFRRVLNAIVEVCIKAKKDVEALKEPALAHLLSPFISEVDEKMKTEMELITGYEYADKIIYIGYNKKNRSSGLYTLFQDPEKEFIKSFGNKVRKKFWTLLEKMFQEIFSKEEIDTDKPIYEFQEDNKCPCPKFKSFTNVLVYTWKMMLPFYPLVFDEEVSDKNVDRIQNIQTNLEEFNDFADVCLWAGSNGSPNVVIDEKVKVSPRTNIESPWENKSQSALSALGYNDNSATNILFTMPVQNTSNEPEWMRSLGISDPGYGGGFQQFNNPYNNFNNPFSNNNFNSNPFLPF